MKSTKSMIASLLTRLSRRKHRAVSMGGDNFSPNECVIEAAGRHAAGISALYESRRLLKNIYPYAVDEEDAIIQQKVLSDRIEEVLERYRKDENVYKYFYGYPYQGLALAGVFGDRVCDYRFDTYELRRFIRPEDSVLDLGCNCGFMAILASYRIGCRAMGVDINPYMIEIGRLVAEHLRVASLVELVASDLTNFRPRQTFDVVMSFATHWTDDGNYRVSVEEHMSRVASYLRPGGILLFETHCNDLESDEFRSAMRNVKDLFEWESFFKKTDSNTREFYVMRKR